MVLAMQERLNKPKVFLSHAWEDKPFIERVATDLQRCGIDYWIDKERIRDGESWLRMIFEDGIPTCDVVLVYFTQESLNSKMVKKELDAAVIHHLSENGVRLLPYVADGSLRGQLRTDLQALQCREWNVTNYDTVLPTVVAAIWRSYLERTIDNAIVHEKSRRLEQELENKKLKEQYEASVFSPREEQEFRYLYRQLNRKTELTFSLEARDNSEENASLVRTDLCRPTILHILLATIEAGGIYLDTDYFGFYLSRQMGETVTVDGIEFKRNDFTAIVDSNTAVKLQMEVHTYGLTTIVQRKAFERWESVYQISDKMYRLKFWIEYNNLSPSEPIEHIVSVKPVQTVEPANAVEQEHRWTGEAQAIDKRINEVRRRRAWSTSGEGVTVATEAVQAMFDILKNRVAKSNLVFENIQLDFESESDSCVLSAGDLILRIEWNHPTEATAECTLRLRSTLPSGKQESEGPLRQVFANELAVRPDGELRPVWSQRNGSYGDYSSPLKLADYCWTTFMSVIRSNEEYLIS